MGNDESDDFDDYDSEEDYGSELEQLKARRDEQKKLQLEKDSEDEYEYTDEEGEDE